MIKNTAQGGVFITDTPQVVYLAYISALIGVLEKAQVINNEGRKMSNEQVAMEEKS